MLQVIILSFFGEKKQLLKKILAQFGGSDGKVCLQCGRPGFNPWVGKISWRREWQPTPVLLPRKFHAQRSLVGYGVAKSWTRLNDFTFTFKK